jgi:hypothetical protein
LFHIPLQPAEDPLPAFTMLHGSLRRAGKAFVTKLDECPDEGLLS